MAKLCRKLKWLVFFGDTVYTAHRAVIFAVAHLCCFFLRHGVLTVAFIIKIQESSDIAKMTYARCAL